MGDCCEFTKVILNPKNVCEMFVLKGTVIQIILKFSAHTF